MKTHRATGGLIRQALALGVSAAAVMRLETPDSGLWPWAVLLMAITAYFVMREARESVSEALSTCRDGRDLHLMGKVVRKRLAISRATIWICVACFVAMILSSDFAMAGRLFVGTLVFLAMHFFWRVLGHLRALGDLIWFEDRRHEPIVVTEARKSVNKERSEWLERRRKWREERRAERIHRLKMLTKPFWWKERAWIFAAAMKDALWPPR